MPACCLSVHWSAWLPGILHKPQLPVLRALPGDYAAGSFTSTGVDAWLHDTMCVHVPCASMCVHVHMQLLLRIAHIC